MLANQLYPRGPPAPEIWRSHFKKTALYKAQLPLYISFRIVYAAIQAKEKPYRSIATKVVG